MDWSQHAAHRRQVVEDQGQWVGLVDNNGIPIMDMAPIISMSAPQARMQVTDFEMTVSTRSANGVVHPIVDQLVGEGLAHALDLDDEGRFSFQMDEVRFVVVERPGLRQVFYVVLCVAHGDADSPQQITIKGVDVLDVLNRLPCPSYYGSWKKTDPPYQWRVFEWDWASDENAQQRFKTPRRMRPLELATRTDGFAHRGAAVTTLHSVIGKSLEAAYVAAGVSGDDRPLVLVPLPAGFVDDSPSVVVAPRDKSIMDDLGDVARAAGVEFVVQLWWPGDPQPPGLVLRTPQLYITVTKTGEV